MNSQIVIMVQVAERTWTLEALHAACLLARRLGARIALVKMVQVQHLGWLGTEMGYMGVSDQERRDVASYQATLEDYGVAYETYLFQYATLTDALVQAAEQVGALFVFATLPKSIIPWWRAWQLRSLRQHLARQQRELIDQPAYTPAFVTVEREAISAL